MDPVNPEHYKVNIPLGSGDNLVVECDDVTEDLGLDHYVAAAFEYLWRSRRKGSEEADLQKAVHRIRRRIAQLQRERWREERQRKGGGA